MDLSPYSLMKHAIPVDLEANNVLFVVPIEDVVAVFRRTTAAPTHSKKREAEADDE